MAHSSWLPTSIVTDGGNYKFNLKITPQIQLPDALYRRAKAMAAAREISLAELVRNGLEYMLRVSAGAEADPIRSRAQAGIRPMTSCDTNILSRNTRDFDGCGLARVFDPCL
jgi:hypothetical protein